MARPTLVIGVGGTGQWVLAHIKKNLLDAYGQVPEGVWLVSLDTTTAPSVSVGGWGSRRSIQAGSGTIDLASEHVFVGGDASKYAAEVKKGGLPCVGSWFDANWFTNLPSGITLLKMEMGAGRFRPLGRLAVFYSLSQGANSSIRNILERAVNGIRQKGETTLYACLTGSFAGGTGSGMFADVAHLIRSIGAEKGITAKIRGYFVLPEAFSGTVSIRDQQYNDMLAKSFAAMREIARFGATFEYAEGYPMFYECGTGSGDPLLQRYVNSTLFELLYYFDGKRPRNSLHQVELENGVAPTIAEEILAMMDQSSGRILEEHAVNITADRNTFNVSNDVVTVGSIGSYTWVFPIYDIIESWTYRLAQDVLQFFLQPEGDPDRRTSALVRLHAGKAGGRDSLYGEDAAVSFWDSAQTGENKLGSLPRDLGRTIGYQWTQGEQARKTVVDRLQQRSLDEWVTTLSPQRSEDSEIDPELRSEVERVLYKFLHPQRKNPVGGFLVFGKQYDLAVVPTSATLNEKEEKRDPKLGAERIHKGVNRFFDDHLGAPQQGYRSGGEYSNALKRYADWQVAQFHEVILRFVNSTLNGTEADEPGRAVVNKAGKLGYLIALLQALATHLDGARRAIDDARQEKQKAAKRTEVEKQRTTAYDEMRKRGAKQTDYLEVCQTLLELERWDVAARTAREAAVEMYDFVNDIRQSLDAWGDTLALGRGGVFATVYAGVRQIANDRSATDTLHSVRKVVYDTTYEQQRYQYYTESRRDEVAQVLNDLVWEVGYEQIRNPQTRELRPVPNISLKLRNVEQENGTTAETPLAQQVASTNADVLLRRCRQVFADARESESISAYLLETYNGRDNVSTPEALAQEIFDKNGPLLEYNGSIGVAYNYLRVQRDSNLDRQRDFLNRVLNRLAELSNAPTKAAQIIDSDDPFRMTFLYHFEVMELDKLSAYEKGRENYRQLDETRRKNHHIFPAERNAVFYEVRMQHQVLPHRIVLLLEDPDTFNLAVLAWLYGSGELPSRLINLYTYDDSTGQRRTVWRLTIPPEPGEFDLMGKAKRSEHYFLTHPDKEPSLLDALETFCVGKKARAYQIEGQELEFSAGTEYGADIPYELTNEKLRRSYDEDCARRLEQGSLAKKAPEFQAKLTEASGESLPSLQMLVAQFERISEKVEELDRKSDRGSYPLDSQLYQLVEYHLRQMMINLRAEINRF
jgi:thymidylate synthase